MATRLILLLALFLPSTASAVDPDFDALRSQAVNDPSNAIATGRNLLAVRGLAQQPARQREVLYLMGNAAHRLVDGGLVGEMVRALEALGHAQSDPLALAYAGFLRAEGLFKDGEPQQGLAESMRAASLIQDNADPRVRAIVAMELCDDFNMGFDPRGAIPHCERSSAAWRVLDDDFSLGRALNLEAHARYSLRERDRAAALFEQARRIFVRRGDLGFASSIGDNLAQVYVDLGRAEEALALSREALAAELKSGRVDHALRSRHNIARALLKLGRLNEARDEIATVISEARRLGWKTDLIELLTTQALIARARGNFELALSTQDEIVARLSQDRDHARNITLAELEARFEARERDLRISQLEQENQGRELELQRARAVTAEHAIMLQQQRWQSITAGLAILVLGLLSVLLHQMWRAQRRKAELLRRESRQDPLTGLDNRRAFFHHVDAALKSADAVGGGNVLMILDLDHFKQINDRGGHLFGDQVLVEVATALERTLTGRGRVARLGGEEFGVLATGLAPGEGARLAEQLRNAVHSLPLQLNDEAMRVTISIGVASFDGERCHDVPSWMRAADDALYAAKAHGRNRVVSAVLVQPA